MLCGTFSLKRTTPTEGVPLLGENASATSNTCPCGFFWGGLTSCPSTTWMFRKHPAPCEGANQSLCSKGPARQTLEFESGFGPGNSQVAETMGLSLFEGARFFRG